MIVKMNDTKKPKQNFKRNFLIIYYFSFKEMYLNPTWISVGLKGKTFPLETKLLYLF